MKSSSSTASAISSSISITSNVSCPSTIRHQLPAAKKVNSRNVIKMIGPSTAPSSTSAAAQQKQGVAIQQLSKKNMTQVRLVSKPRRSTTSGSEHLTFFYIKDQLLLSRYYGNLFLFAGRSIMKLRVDKTAKSRPLTRKTSKVEVKLNRTTQLRLIKADPLFDMSKLSTDKQYVHLHFSCCVLCFCFFVYSPLYLFSHIKQTHYITCTGAFCTKASYAVRIIQESIL